MRHIPPKSVGHRTCHTRWSFTQRDHLVPTLVCTIQFTQGTTCLTVNVLNFLATLFQQLLLLALVSLMIYVTHFLLPIEMQKRPGINTCSIFQKNLCIATPSSLSCPQAGIRCNLRIIARTSLSCPLTGIHHTLLLKSNNVPLPSKTIPANTQVLQRGSSSSSFIGLMRVVVWKGGR
jgi:hypothetical protein